MNKNPLHSLFGSTHRTDAPGKAFRILAMAMILSMLFSALGVPTRRVSAAISKPGAWTSR